MSGRSVSYLGTILLTTQSHIRTPRYWASLIELCQDIILCTWYLFYCWYLAQCGIVGTCAMKGQLSTLDRASYCEYGDISHISNRPDVDMLSGVKLLGWVKTWDTFWFSWTSLTGKPNLNIHCPLSLCFYHQHPIIGPPFVISFLSFNLPPFFR